ncbi:hypothetical protein O0I10_005391 [Lichtheimia ornata]|uniref:UspA domain-containing protein n=1 Tax=Lichtheimia ornata TaxID=688661 RepID=A0AAD7V505_9FUNG|nr:uncharacterized protein O0I10_005391 [Lichtheimia ornata]KAJ8659009.1 hypothetical protein O0I10_005391 [Lichtheimia ornata]
MTLCGNESMISSSCASEEDAQSNSSSLLSPIDSRYSRLSFQSADKRSYRHRVSFDMLSHQPFISFTLRTANEGYQPKSSSRLFMVTIDDPSHLDDGTTTKLIRYVMDLVDDGDEVVIVGMQYNSLVGDTPTPKQTATRLLGLALDAQHEDKISITVELALVKPDQALKSMIQLYEPSMLIVGYRKRARKAMLLGNGSTTQAIMNQSLKHTTTNTTVVFVQCQSEEHSIHHPATSSATTSNVRGHRRTITALSSPLPDKGSNDTNFPIASMSQIELGSSSSSAASDSHYHQPVTPSPNTATATAIRPASLVSTTSTGLAAQFRKTLGLWKR